MPYDPNVPTEAQRSAAYSGIWFGLAASTVLVLGRFVSLPWLVEPFALLISAAWIVMFNTLDRFDDYMRQLLNTGLRWSMTFVAAWGLIWSLLMIGIGAHDVGFAAASGEFPADHVVTAPALLGDGRLLAVLAYFLFYVGAAVALVRGR